MTTRILLRRMSKIYYDSNQGGRDPTENVWRGEEHVSFCTEEEMK
jgi:hypothetical protein